MPVFKDMDIEHYILRAARMLGAGASVYRVGRTFRKEGVSVADTYLLVKAGQVMVSGYLENEDPTLQTHMGNMEDYAITN